MGHPSHSRLNGTVAAQIVVDQHAEFLFDLQATWDLCADNLWNAPTETARRRHCIRADISLVEEHISIGLWSNDQCSRLLEIRAGET